MDEDDQVFERFSDFMKEGGCKKSFSALVEYCLEDTLKVWVSVRNTCRF